MGSWRPSRPLLTCSKPSFASMPLTQQKKENRIMKWLKNNFTCKSKREHKNNARQSSEHGLAWSSSDTEPLLNDIYELQDMGGRHYREPSLRSTTTTWSSSFPYARSNPSYVYNRPSAWDTARHSNTTQNTISTHITEFPYGRKGQQPSRGRFPLPYPRPPTQDSHAYITAAHKYRSTYLTRRDSYTPSISTVRSTPRSLTSEIDWERDWDVPLAHRIGSDKVIYQTKDNRLQIRRKSNVTRIQGKEQRDAEAEMFRGIWTTEDRARRLGKVREEGWEAVDLDGEGQSEKTPLNVKPERNSLRRYRRREAEKSGRFNV